MRTTCKGWNKTLGASSFPKTFPKCVPEMIKCRWQYSNPIKIIKHMACRLRTILYGRWRSLPSTAPSGTQKVGPPTNWDDVRPRASFTNNVLVICGDETNNGFFRATFLKIYGESVGWRKTACCMSWKYNLQWLLDFSSCSNLARKKQSRWIPGYPDLYIWYLETKILTYRATKAKIFIKVNHTS